AGNLESNVAIPGGDVCRELLLGSQVEQKPITLIIARCILHEHMPVTVDDVANAPAECERKCASGQVGHRGPQRVSVSIHVEALAVRDCGYVFHDAAVSEDYHSGPTVPDDSAVEPHTLPCALLALDHDAGAGGLGSRGSAAHRVPIHMKRGSIFHEKGRA